MEILYTLYEIKVMNGKEEKENFTKKAQSVKLNKK